MRQVKLPNFDNAQTSALGLNLCFRSLTFGYGADGDDDFLSLEADELLDSFFTKTHIGASNDDSLAGEVGGRIIRSMEKLGTDIIEDTYANELYSQLIFEMDRVRMA